METVEERVEGPASDLVEREQKENKDLTAQIQSFGRSMILLQNGGDHANEELDLKGKYDARPKELHS